MKKSQPCKSWRKAELLEHWHKLEPYQKILSHFTPIPPNATDPLFGACGIRITGNPKFIDAVLSNFKEILDAENYYQILHIQRQTVKPIEFTNGYHVVTKKWENKDTDVAESLYIQIRIRQGKKKNKKIYPSP